MPERTRHQEKIIKNYYNNREAIAVQRLQELVTELYLSEGKKRQQHWKNIAIHLEKLEVSPERIQQLTEEDNPEKMARFLQTLTKGK